MSLINTNQLTATAHIYTKSSTNSYAEYQAFQFIRKFNILKIPDNVSFDESTNTISMERVNGVLLIKLLRDMRLDSNVKNLLTNTVVSKITNAVTSELLSGVNRLQKAFNLNKSTIQLDFHKYNYFSKLLESVDILATYCSAITKTEALENLKALSYSLENIADVPFLDAPAYNVIVDLNETDSFTLVKDNNVEGLLNRLVFIDFETFGQIVTPYDDIALILESSVFQNVGSKDIYINFQSNRNYVFAALFRNIRNYVRHLEYLLSYPDIYLKRYIHYGSCEEESPSWYMERIKSNLKDLKTLHNIHFIELEHIIQVVDKAMAPRCQSALENILLASG